MGTHPIFESDFDCLTVKMADREGRKAELERKKARLLAMRAEKNKKEELRRKEAAESRDGIVSVSRDQSDLDWKRDETSRILEGLGLPEQSPASGGDQGRPASPKSTDTIQSVDSTGDKQQGVVSVRSRPPPRYASTQVSLHNVPPKELVLYAKETQTKEIEPEVLSEEEPEVPKMVEESPGANNNHVTGQN